MNKLTNDYGADPIGRGMFRMVPSGDVVDSAERHRRLAQKPKRINDIFGMSWGELERKQDLCGTSLEPGQPCIAVTMWRDNPIGDWEHQYLNVCKL